MIDLTLAQAKVTSLEEAELWYTTVFGSPPDTRPMDGLIEWRFGPHHGVQVFREAEGAGGSTIVVGATDFDEMIARFDAEGVDHSGVRQGGGGRLVMLTDPSDNQVVVLDPQAAHGQPDD